MTSKWKNREEWLFMSGVVKQKNTQVVLSDMHVEWKIKDQIWWSLSKCCSSVWSICKSYSTHRSSSRSLTNCKSVYMSVIDRARFWSNLSNYLELLPTVWNKNALLASGIISSRAHAYSLSFNNLSLVFPDGLWLASRLRSASSHSISIASSSKYASK